MQAYAQMIFSSQKVLLVEVSESQKKQPMPAKASSAT